MKKLLLLLLLFSDTSHRCVWSQKTNKEVAQIEPWLKAIVNIETEGSIYPGYYMDSVFESKKKAGYNGKQLDSLAKILTVSRISTGTAIYAVYEGRKYLISAKHVLSDDVCITQKIYENNAGIAKWDTLEAIFPRISIRTPYSYFSAKRMVNNYAVFNNNFVKGPKPYFFISDSTGDGIAVISLQEPFYRILDSLLIIGGYSPISLKDVITDQKINLLDNVYAIGFPEMVSIVAKVIPPKGSTLHQSTDLVKPFVVKGYVAMYDPLIQHFYADLTITPGNSGSPIIKEGKLIGIVSGINKYKVIDENVQPLVQNIYGIGHLVNIINISLLIKRLNDYKVEESRLPTAIAR